MITYKDLKIKWRDEFKKHGIENPDFEINEILGLVLNADCRSNAFTDILNTPSETECKISFEQLCERRINGEPLQYILGEWEFYGIPFKVGKGVLVPRQDTETLVDIAIDKLKNRENLTVVDLCSGSGCIALALEQNLNCSEVICVENSHDAFEYLERNINLNNSSAKTMFADVLDEKTLSDVPKADLIVCNPPYVTEEEMKTLQPEVTFEPEYALCGGEDGLDYYRSIIRLWKNKLNDDGMMLFEIGMGQEDEVMRIMIQHGLKDVRTRKDLCGINRCVFGFARKNPKLCTDVMRV